MTIQELLQLVHERKAYYVSIGWQQSDCWIGLFDGMLKLASDHGASTYRDRGDGVIIRDAFAHRSKLVEFIETDISMAVSIHNRTILDGIRSKAGAA